MTETDQICLLCDLPLTDRAVTNDAGDEFCCRGCREVHATLKDREDVSVDLTDEEIQETLAAPETESPDHYERTFLRVDGMHCSTCETFIESRAHADEHVGEVDASYITDTVRIDHDPAAMGESDLIDRLSGLGYRAYARDDPLGERRAEDEILLRLVVGVLFGMMVMLQYFAVIYPTYFDGLYYPQPTAEFLAEMLASRSATYFYLTVGFSSSIVLAYTGGPILKGAYVSIKMRQPNMDLLVALAACAAWAYSTVAIFTQSGLVHLYYDVTVGIILVVTAGSYYENEIKRTATEELAGLTQAQVTEARRYEGGETTTVAVEELTAGDRVLVREGERVPVDGSVRDGDGTVDEAVVTGESMPVGKTDGDEVVGGSLLLDGSFVVQAGEGATSSIDRITDVVWDLQSANHGIQQLANRLATVFVPVVLVLAGVVGSLHFLLGASGAETLLVALTVLIVSCPCALGLATPLAIASSIREALSKGIVVFDETIFERLRGVDVVVFDKTGTLSTGEMSVHSAVGPSDVFEKAARLETRSSHPVAGAIADEFSGDSEAASDGSTAAVTDGGENSGRNPTNSREADGGVVDHEVSERSANEPPERSPNEPPERSPNEAPERPSKQTREPSPNSDGNSPPTDAGTDGITDFESHASGVEGTVDGTSVLVGTIDLFESRGWSVPAEIRTEAESARTAGNVAVVVGKEGRASGVAAVGDEPRDGWEQALETLDEKDVEIAVLTGDSEEASSRYAAHPAVDEVFAGVPPEAKAETVRRYGASKQTVMVGDGTNDAPALATADLGIALGSGTALAADAADVAIVTDSLDSLETVFDLADAANRRVKQNIGWAFLYNGIAIPLAITGLINPLFAAIAMGLSSLLVVSNSSRSLL